MSQCISEVFSAAQVAHIECSNSFQQGSPLHPSGFVSHHSLSPVEGSTGGDVQILWKRVKGQLMTLVSDDDFYHSLGSYPQCDGTRYSVSSVCHHTQIK
jgi:hypothetical protein